MSKLKCQMKPKCLNDKTYFAQVSVSQVGRGATHGGANFSSIWSFDI